MLAKFLTVLGIFGLVYGCTSTTPQIVERMEGFKDTPDFATGQKVMWSEGKTTYFVNIVTLKGNARPEVCLKVASLDAKVEMLKYIGENITSSGQLSEMSVDSDPAYESMTAFISQGKISGASVAERYFDKREELDESGEKTLKMRCAVKIAVEKAHLAQQLRDATNSNKGNPQIREKLMEAQKKFLDSI